MSPRTVILMAAAVASALLPAPSGAQDLSDVGEIVRRANLAAYYAGRDGRARARMTIVDAQERTRVRQFTMLRRNRSEGGDQDFAVLFSRPADVRNTVFLVNKHVGADDDRWIYLPGLDLVKRIAAGDKRTSFVGSHFVYEDVSGRAVDADRHELIETTDAFYVVRNTPVDPGAVAFASWVARIDKVTFLPMVLEYVDDSGEVFRRIESLEVADFDGYPTVTKMKSSDLRSGGHTITEFRNIQYDLDIPQSVFTERTLRNPPRQWFTVR